MSDKRVYFVSDAHLGSGADSRERELQLCRWLDEIGPTCGCLVLLGDMFDFWFSYRHVVPRGNVRLLGKLAAMADSGVDIHFFIGNHDMWVFDYLTEECGITVHNDPEAMTFGGKRFLIGHGDGLGHTDRWFDFVRHFFRSRVCQRLFAALPSSLTFPIARRWSDSNKRRHEREDCQRYLGDDREGIVIYCKERLQREHFDYCVFGHRHTPLVRELKVESKDNFEIRNSKFEIQNSSADAPATIHSTYVNTGDWLTHRSYAVFDPATGILELKEY